MSVDFAEWDADVDVIDMEKALAQACDDPGFLGELCSDMIADVETRLEAIASAVAAADWEALRLTCHAIKGASANMSLLQLHAVSKSGEQAAIKNASDADAADTDKAERLRAAMVQASENFKQWHDEHKDELVGDDDDNDDE